MSLLGKAAMVLQFDIAPGAIAEHDDWHTHEHFPERLSIPGFLRGSRWVALSGQPRYFVMYEVEKLAVLASGPYLERLNHPTPWTAKMMTHYRGMIRGFCGITAAFGLGTGQTSLVLRFKPAPGGETALREWFAAEALPALPSKPGLASAVLLEAALKPPATNEQRIRGADATLDWVLVVTGYGTDKVASLFEHELGVSALERHGATAVAAAVYRMEYSLTRGPKP